MNNFNYTKVIIVFVKVRRKKIKKITKSMKFQKAIVKKIGMNKLILN